MPRIEEDIAFGPYKLDSKLLYLHTDYLDIYNMNYLDKSDLDNPIDLIFKIKDAFSTFNMTKYYGSRSNLTCYLTRQIYLSMNKYFSNLFLNRLGITFNNNLKELDNNDDFMCLISECASIIRGSIKKYTRIRTGKNQTKCKKEKLERRDRREYKCPEIIENNQQCPSFNALRTLKGYTCKDIFLKTDKINPLYTLLAEASRIYNKTSKNNESRNLNVTATPIYKFKRNRHTRRERPRRYSNSDKNKLVTLVNNKTHNLNNYNILE